MCQATSNSMKPSSKITLPTYEERGDDAENLHFDKSKTDILSVVEVFDVRWHGSLNLFTLSSQDSNSVNGLFTCIRPSDYDPFRS